MDKNKLNKNNQVAQAKRVLIKTHFKTVKVKFIY